MKRERTKLQDEVSLKLFRDGKLIEVRETQVPESRLFKVLKYLLSLFGEEE